MPSLAFTRAGHGDPLVLLHGIGSSREVWDSVVLTLAARFDVIAVDLPGFGESAPLPPTVEPLPVVLAEEVAQLLDDLAVSEPNVVGNSLGGWVALELAGLRTLGSLTLLSPAGLWRGRTPIYNLVSLRATRWLAHHAGRPLRRLVGTRLGRAVVLGQTHGHPMRLTPAYARGAITAMGTCPGFDATLAATVSRHFEATHAITAPLTVAFGSRDRLLLRGQSRHLDQLPPDTRVAALPGCGHLPMADDPAAVAALIETSAAGRALRQPPRSASR